MSFETAIDDALADIFAQIGISAIFTNSSGNTFPCNINLTQETEEEPVGYDAQTYRQGTTIEALIAEIEKEPDLGETFTVGSTVYTVKRIVENNGRAVKVAVK